MRRTVITTLLAVTLLLSRPATRALAAPPEKVSGETASGYPPWGKGVGALVAKRPLFRGVRYPDPRRWSWPDWAGERLEILRFAVLILVVPQPLGGMIDDKLAGLEFYYWFSLHPMPPSGTLPPIPTSSKAGSGEKK